jgi:hypothetical protein
MSQEPEVFSISGVTASTTESQRARQRTYLLSMSIRTACFVLAIFTHGALRWTLLAGALLLPYFSVIVANAGRERRLYNFDKPESTANRPSITAGE